MAILLIVLTFKTNSVAIAPCKFCFLHFFAWLDNDCYNKSCPSIGSMEQVQLGGTIIEASCLPMGTQLQWHYLTLCNLYCWLVISAYLWFLQFSYLVSKCKFKLDGVGKEEILVNEGKRRLQNLAPKLVMVLLTCRKGIEYKMASHSCFLICGGNWKLFSIKNRPTNGNTKNQINHWDFACILRIFFPKWHYLWKVFQL